MATAVKTRHRELTLYYDTRNSIAAKTVDYILSLGVFKTKQEADSRILADLSEAFDDVKLHEQGEIKLKSLKEVLNEF